eukprot:GHVO01014913.1.p1 GENE.GHVO01014913.1~~GHVO01014913.1.p1  ORF type:complete len:475 (+),score=55.05 GHVO01014913.1:22-1446(+)
MFGSTPAAGGMFGAPASSMFGGATTTPAATGGSLFGAATTTPAATGGSLFGGGAAAPAPTGGSLFGGGTAPAATGGSLFGGGTAPAATGGSLFGGGAAAPAATGGESTSGSLLTSGGLFGNTSTPSAAAPQSATAGSSGVAPLTTPATAAPTQSTLFTSLSSTAAAPTSTGAGLFGTSGAAGGGSLFGTSAGTSASLAGLLPKPATTAPQTETSTAPATSAAPTSTGAGLFGTSGAAGGGSLFGTSAGTSPSLGGLLTKPATTETSTATATSALGAPAAATSAGTAIKPASTSISIKESAFESLHLERVDDLLSSYEKRLKGQIRDFGKLSTQVVSTDKELFDFVAKLETIQKEQRAAEDGQRVGSEMLARIENQQISWGHTLDQLESALRSRVPANMEPNPMQSHIQSLSEELDKQERSEKELAADIQEMATLAYSDTLLDVIKIFRLQNLTLEKTRNQIEALTTRLDSLEKR